MADDEDEWESAADNFQVNLKVSIQRDDEDEWENSVDEFVVSGTEIKTQIAGSSIDYPQWRTERGSVICSYFMFKIHWNLHSERVISDSNSLQSRTWTLWT
jgi:hypothetical protein